MKSQTSFITSCLLTLSLGFAQTGCSTVGSLFGNVNPVESRAPAPKGLDLGKLNPEWKNVSSSGVPGTPDVEWQSQKTSSVISLTSACRENFEGNQDLKEITSGLLSQWQNLKVLSEKNLVVAGFPALETTAKGKYLERTRMFQTVAVKSPQCVYDLIFLSSVESFDQDLAIFKQFRDSLTLK